jgi:hypothetical protein
MYVRTRSTRRVRRLRSPRASHASRPLFLRKTTQHLRVIPRRRVARASWIREIARVTVALANAAAFAMLFYLFF